MACGSSKFVEIVPFKDNNKCVTVSASAILLTNVH